MSIYDKIFYNCKNLITFDASIIERLDGKEVKIPKPALVAVRKSLQSNEQLEKLTLNINDDDLSLEDWFSEVNCKLIKVRFSIRMTQASKFLMTKAHKLKVLGKLEQETFETILAMPRLKKIVLHHCFSKSFFRLAAEYSQQNFSVTHVELPASWEADTNDLKVIFNTFPNIETLSIGPLKDKSADLIATTCTSLKKLHVETFAVTKIANKKFFLKLDEFSCVRACFGARKMIKTLSVETPPMPYYDLDHAMRERRKILYWIKFSGASLIYIACCSLGFYWKTSGDLSPAFCYTFIRLSFH